MCGLHIFSLCVTFLARQQSKSNKTIRGISHAPRLWSYPQNVSCKLFVGAATIMAIIQRKRIRGHIYFHCDEVPVSAVFSSFFAHTMNSRGKLSSEGRHFLPRCVFTFLPQFYSFRAMHVVSVAPLLRPVCMTGYGAIFVVGRMRKEATL